MDLNEIAVFVRVIQAGSFSKAAKLLNMPNSTVSSRVSSLEKRLGTTLIQRTTRKLSVTPAGDAFFKRAVQGLAELQDAENELTAIQAEPQGLLKITAPVELGSSLLPDVIAAFGAKYPKVQVELVLSDRRIDLLGEGVDLAIRAGELKDSSMIAKKLGSVYFGAFASPKYLKNYGSPQAPKDLREHRCVQFTPLGREHWILRNGKSVVDAKVSGQLVVNDLSVVKALVLSDHGIGLLPSFFCYPEVRAGKMVRVLPEWRSNLNPVHFVYPAQKFVLPKVSAFMNLAAEAIQRSLQANEL